uniref:Uncharacterized protein orf84 n=1 Tax=Monomastix sp. (strain OKE-1) TaxID=141716 RepID=C0JWP6_MONSK|nr:hypothetical protein MoOKC_p062 [Monomastix sp. OKE-1]ACK36922.1 unknown [Monomastix sp. OKE-1]
MKSFFLAIKDRRNGVLPTRPSRGTLRGSREKDQKTQGPKDRRPPPKVKDLPPNGGRAGGSPSGLWLSGPSPRRGEAFGPQWLKL